MIELRGAATGYGAVPVFENMNFAVGKGSAMAVAGPNGAGKTTLMLLMAGMLPLWRGAMYLAGNDVSALGAEERIRVGVALCPEGRRIFATLTVEENLRLGATTLRRSFDRSGVRRAINDGFEQVYSMFPILGERRQGPGGALSGGQQQMLAIGRALMSRPSVLLLDEPSLGLAPLIVDEVYEHLEKLKQSGLTIVVVEESASRVMSFADTALVLRNGRVILQGDAKEVSEHLDLAKAYVGDTAG